MRESDVLGLAIRRRILICREACEALVMVSEACADACWVLEGEAESTDWCLANLDCVETCLLANMVLSWHVSRDRSTTLRLLATCRVACAASKIACELLADKHEGWDTCSVACDRVSEACARLMAILK